MNHQIHIAMKNILVGIDFDENTELLIDKAVEIAKQFESKIWLLHVATPSPDFVGYEVGPQYIRDSRAEELMNEHKDLAVLTDTLKEKGLDVDGLLIQGATIDIILEESSKLNIDLIVAGYHEHNFLYKTFFGSTSSEIISKSHIPVLVVPFVD